MNKSEDATAQFWAYRFEMVARVDTEQEVKDMIQGLEKSRRIAVRKDIRKAWKEEFGRPEWVPRPASQED